MKNSVNIKKNNVGYSVAVLVISLVLCACGERTISPIEDDNILTADTKDNIIKSKNDSRNYEVVKLANELEIILVSDPSLDRSAVALAVNAGSYDEIDGFWGQAHYLEHMLFLGTKKYPKAGSYSQFISSNGGQNNAYTDMDHTNYMVSIQNKAFEPLLDRFSDYFKAPLLSPEYIDKERHAVHSEWSMKGIYDGVILGHLNGLTLNPQHPVANFTWGNLATLTDQPKQTLHQATVNFYNQHYSANRMKVAMVSNRSIVELKTLAQQYFGDIPNKNAPQPFISVPVITEQQMKNIIRYKPNKDLKKIQLKFVIRNNSDQFLAKPNHFITALLNSEMPGTLTTVLRDQGLIEGLSAWADPKAFTNAGEFVIDIDLTENGLNERSSIISAVFDYLDLIDKQGVSEKYYLELKQSLSNGFEFQSKYSEYSYAADLAAKMHHTSNKYVLSNDYELTTFKPAAIHDVLAQLTLDRVRVFFIDKNQTPKKKMRYFNSHYQIDPISPEQEKLWRSGNNKISLMLPELNSLLPSSFTLVKHNTQNKPVMLKTEQGSLLYLKQSDTFKVPKGSITVNLNTQQGTESPKQQVLLLLLHKALEEKLKNLTSEAYSAGMSLSVTANRGLTISSSGFTDKQLTLLEKAFTVVNHLSINEDGFTTLKEMIARSLNDRQENALYTQAFDYYNTFLVEGSYEIKDLQSSLAQVSLDNLMQFKTLFLESLKLNTFAFGNFEQQVLLAFIEKTEKLLNLSVDNKSNKSNENNKGLYFTQYYPFNANEKINLTVNAKQPDVAIIDAKWQERTVKREATGKVLAKIISPALFKQIRTEEQLGYSVGFYSTVRNEQVTYAWYVQTPVKSPVAMMKRFDAFRERFVADLAIISEEELAQYRQAVLVPLLQEASYIYQEQSHYLEDWQQGNDKFDSKQRLIEAINKVTIEDVHQLYQQLLADKGMARIIVQIKGNNYAESDFIDINKI